MTVQNVSVTVYYSTLFFVFLTFYIFIQTNFGTERNKRVICTIGHVVNVVIVRLLLTYFQYVHLHVVQLFAHKQSVSVLH